MICEPRIISNFSNGLLVSRTTVLELLPLNAAKQPRVKDVEQRVNVAAVSLLNANLANYLSRSIYI